MQVNLALYHEIVATHQQRVHSVHSHSHALRCATECLNDVASVVDHNEDAALYAEAEYLWSLCPPERKSLAKYQEIISVLLAQTLDVYWYGAYPRYESDQDVHQDSSLRSFQRRTADFSVQFAYVQYYRQSLMRVPNALRLRYRRFTNHPGRYTQGLTTTRCKQAMAALINYLAETVAGEIRAAHAGPLMVNSVLRTVDYQHALACLGYVAPRNSSHLAGYAVDLEKRWYGLHHRPMHNAIHAVLSDLVEQSMINVIDEGTHWHVCLNPAFCGYFNDLFRKWERT